uniref:Uncharacterized protein n=1 Tax=Lactuca sativa TaxID=4236 RepID=A0A9R1VYS4_LACSA|nr:hypothetical protein LSAT_V11C400210940 [Lactuca sativa]
MSILINTTCKNYIDTYEEVDEELSTIVSLHNDSILPRKGQTLILVFCRERILSSILFEVCILITTLYGASAPNWQYYPYYFS